MLELDLRLTSRQALEFCLRDGLIVRSTRALAGAVGGRHWHLARPGRAGTLEISESGDRVWAKVHPLRDGGWAGAFARELAREVGDENP